MKISNLIFVFIFISSLKISAQQPGELDLSFGDQGRVYEDFGGSSQAYDMAILPDDRILIAGFYDSEQTGQRALIARYLPDGDFDPDFGQFGRVIANIGGTITRLTSVKALADGRFYVAGKTHFEGKDRILVVRLHPDGDFDTSFGTNGYSLVSVEEESGQLPSGLVVDNAGRILVSGRSYLEDGRRPLVTRLDSTGSLDLSFGENGFVLPHVEHEDPLAEIRFDGIALQNDGKIVAAGYYGVPLDFKGMVMRFNEDGSPDPDFGENGVTTISENYEMHHIYDVATTAEDNIMISGNYFDINVGPAYLLMRLLPDGSIDTEFGNNGYSTPEVMINGSFGRAISTTTEPNGPVTVFGSTGDNFSGIRVTDDGILDSDFAATGIVLTSANGGSGRIRATGLQSDGKLIAAGSRFFNLSHTAVLLRYHTGSTLSADDHVPVADLQAYPNPSRDHVRIILPATTESARKGAQTLTLHNPNGQRVMERGVNGDASIEIDVSGLAQGIYHLTVTDRSGQVYRKKIAVL